MAKRDEAPENFQQGLQNLIPQIASLMASPDADIKFCQQLMMVCAGKLRQHQQGAVAGVGGAGAAGPGGVGATGAGRPPSPPGMSMPGGPAGGGAINPMQPSMAAPQLMSGSPTPTPDELRRVISQSTS